MPKIEISEKGNKCTYVHIICMLYVFLSLHWSGDQASVSRILFCCLFASECTTNILVVNWKYISFKKNTDHTDQLWAETFHNHDFKKCISLTIMLLWLCKVMHVK